MRPNSKRRRHDGDFWWDWKMEWDSLRMNTPLDVVSTITQPGTQLTSVVNSSMSVRVEFVYDFQHEEQSSRLTLRITAHASRLLTGFILARAKQAQAALLRQLNQRFKLTVDTVG